MQMCKREQQMRSKLGLHVRDFSSSHVGCKLADHPHITNIMLESYDRNWKKL